MAPSRDAPPPLDILRFATQASAETLGAGDELGQLSYARTAFFYPPSSVRGISRSEQLGRPEETPQRRSREEAPRIRRPPAR